MADNRELTHVVTGMVRFLYVSLNEPKQQEGDKEAKYSTTILVPKTDLDTKAKLDRAYEAAKQIGKSKYWEGKLPSANVLHNPIQDGDGLRKTSDEPFGEECKGHWVINTKSRNQPKIVDSKKNEIIDKAEIYSGMYGRVAIDFFPYNNNGKGVSVGLGNVQKLKDGDPLGYSYSIDEDFGDDFTVINDTDTNTDIDDL